MIKISVTDLNAAKVIAENHEPEESPPPPAPPTMPVIPTVGFAAALSSASEAVSSRTVTVTLSQASTTNAISVNYAVMGGTADGDGVDHSLPNGTLTFAIGETSKDITITVVNEDLYEPDETIILSLSSPTNATLGMLTTHTHTITNDDANINRIYRSVGPGQPGPLATGSVTNSLTITAKIAHFSSPLVPTDIGVGDVIIYDCDGNSSLNSFDCLAFITSRGSASSYSVAAASGATAPNAQATPTPVWRIYRAYTSLADASSGIENSGLTGLAGASGNFDDWTLGRDLVTNNEQWNIALYAGSTADTAAVLFTGWTTSATQYLRLFTPTKTSEVAVSQRHSGVWTNSAYRLITGSSDPSTIGLQINFLRVEGLQIENAYTINSRDLAVIEYAPSYFNISGPAAFYITDNIMRFQQNIPTGNSALIWIDNNTNNTSITSIVANNLLYATSFSNVNGINIGGVGHTYIYSNTLYGFYDGLKNYNPGNATHSINNIVVNCSNSCFSAPAAFANDSNYNLTDYPVATSGANDYVNASAVFYNTATQDFRLSLSSIDAIGHASNLSANPNYSFILDLTGFTRPLAWDIGAIQAR